MGNAPAPPAGEIFGLLRGLRRYRATLEGPAQLLLDTLVIAALNHTPEQPLPEGLRPLWNAYGGGRTNGTDVVARDGAAIWTTTPWGAAYGVVRYGPSPCLAAQGAGISAFSRTCSPPAPDIRSGPGTPGPMASSSPSSSRPRC
jgi:hypothetical protein